MELKEYLERVWCPRCRGKAVAPPDREHGGPQPSGPMMRCYFCKGTGRVWAQDKRAWLARERSKE